MDQMGDHMKIDFDSIQIPKMLQTVRVEKVDETNEFISLDFMLPSWVMVDIGYRGPNKESWDTSN